MCIMHVMIVKMQEGKTQGNTGNDTCLLRVLADLDLVNYMHAFNFKDNEKTEQDMGVQ